jgi:Holliday junction resolvasome RuvABC endonuclease subunit
MKLKDEYILMCVDPSLKQTGWAIIKVTNNEPYNYSNKNLQLLDYGIIPTHNIAHGQALIYFEKIISEQVDKYKPDYVTSEQMFAGNNRVTAMRLANIHGILQLVCAKANLDIVYYSVMTAKSQTLNGIITKKQDGTKKTGDEMKEEVAEEILRILGKDAFFKEYTLDVTDSISMGITFIKLDGEQIQKPKKKKKSKKAVETKNEPVKKVKKNSK